MLLDPEAVDDLVAFVPHEHIAEVKAPVFAAERVLLEHARPPLLEGDRHTRVHRACAVATVRVRAKSFGVEEVAFAEARGHGLAEGTRGREGVAPRMHTSVAEVCRDEARSDREENAAGPFAAR